MRPIVCLDSRQDVDSLLINLYLVLIPQLPHACLHFFVKSSELLVQILFLTQPALEHLDLVTQFVILKLVFVRLTTNLIIAFLSELLEFTLFAVLKMVDHLPSLLKLKSEILNQAILVVF